MLERMSNGWVLAKQSFEVLRLDKEMLLFPLLSMLSCVAVFASFAVPLWNSDYAQVLFDDTRVPDNPLAYVFLFAFYFANYFVIVFFNSALVACAIIRFNGGNPNVADGLSMAVARLPQILGWSLVSATVGFILKLIESRSERAGQFAAALLGMAWSAATYFVVPVLVVEKLGPLDAVKRSVSILKRSWGEALVANFGIGLIAFVLWLVALIPAILGISLGGVAAVTGIVTTVLLCILVALVSSAVNTIVLAAIYMYAAEGTVPRQFDESLLEHAFVRH